MMTSIQKPAVFLVTMALMAACATPQTFRAATQDQTVRSTAGLPKADSPISIQPGLTARFISDGAWVITHEYAYNSNILVIQFADGTVLLCSSPFDTQTTRALLGWVRTHLHPKRMVAINTHWHMDGSGGNAAYKEAGVTTYASTHTQRLARERGPRLRESAAEGLPSDLAANVRATSIVDADRTFLETKGLLLTFGDERVEVQYPGPAHSQDNVVVYFPARKILFGGCALKVGDSIGYLGDASLADWEPALDVMRQFDSRIVIPGHGSTGGPEIIENTLRLVREAREPAKR